MFSPHLAHICSKFLNITFMKMEILKILFLRMREEVYSLPLIYVSLEPNLICLQ